MNPLELIYSVPSWIVAIGAYMWTQTIKTVIDVSFQVRGKDRRDNIWLTRFVLPAIPPLAGALFAVVIPLRPESLLAYVDTYGSDWGWVNRTLVFGAWGAACGQFSDYLYTKIKKAIEDYKVKTNG